MSNKALEKLVWMLIYGGLLVLSLGIFIKRQDAHFGWSLVVGGAVLAITGAVLIYVRSRRSNDKR